MNDYEYMLLLEKLMTAYEQRIIHYTGDVVKNKRRLAELRDAYELHLDQSSERVVIRMNLFKPKDGGITEKAVVDKHTLQH